MFIAVDEHLTDIKSELKSRGYNIGHKDHSHIGVYIYKNHDTIGDIQRIRQHHDSMKYHHGVDESSDIGMLLINAKDKNIDEIQQMIDQRTYSSLDLY